MLLHCVTSDLTHSHSAIGNIDFWLITILEGFRLDKPCKLQTECSGLIFVTFFVATIGSERFYYFYFCFVFIQGWN